MKSRPNRFHADSSILAAGALIALLALGIALTLSNVRRVNQDADWVAHSYEVMEAVADIRGRLREAEAVQRTFLIQGGSSVPTELHDNLARARDEMTQLTKLVADNEDQTQRASELDKLVEQFGESLVESAQIRIDQGFEASREIVRQGEESRQTAAMAEILRDLDATERRLLHDRLAEQRSSYRQAFIVGLLAGLTGIAGLVALILMQRRRLADRVAAATVIAEQRERLATIVESSNDAIISKSLDGRIESWNAAAEKLLGYTGAEAIGQPVTLILPPEGEAEELLLIERLRKGERIELYETTRRHKDGRLVDVSLTLSPVHDSGGRINGASTIIRDISERLEAERTRRESEERFRTLADNMSQFAWMADAKGWIFWYNRRWYDYTGTTLEEMQGWGWKKVHHPDHLERVVERLQRSWDTGEEWEDMFPLRSKTGEYRWFLSRALPIRDEDGKILRWLGTNTDVTEQREAEQALQEADRRKNEFLAMLAHELRNPLGPIRNGLEILDREQAYDAEAVPLMRRQVDQLVRLVEDLLDVSRIMRGKVELRKAPVELNELVQQSVVSVRDLIDRRGQTLDVSLSDGEVWLSADAVRLTQVVGNLLNNASKYSDAGGAIQIAVTRNGDEAEIAIRDDGMGIEAELLPHVFELFTQADRALDRSQGGLGIGLTVVNQLVHRHGGRVEAASDGLGHGSVFTITLPVDDAAKIDAAPADGSQHKPASISDCFRILVVDDNVGAAWMLTRLLEKIGHHQVKAVHDGPSAIAEVRKSDTDVVILDIGLPGMDGYEVARRLRARPRARRLTLIALTGYGQEEDRRRTDAAGFDFHLVKPANIDEIEGILAEIASAPATPDASTS
ncbi:MAG: hybrid sensor histidine kinase/response regulator [Planctomycetaceae bacterium]|nr:hybrid sensor histidine kinase/response regulator [Planctomycetaceae bacterium]